LGQPCLILPFLPEVTFRAHPIRLQGSIRSDQMSLGDNTVGFTKNGTVDYES
jgi:hypothetical protein